MIKSDSIRVGINPTMWSNDDVPAFGADISFEQCLDEVARAGYEGCEVNYKFPRDPRVLTPALHHRKLELISAWFSAYFATPGRFDETITRFVEHMDFLKAMGSSVIVVCECSDAIQGQDKPIIEQRPVFKETQWEHLIQGLHKIGELSRANNMSITYHHHMGTGVQTHEEIDFLMDQTDPSLVSLLLDTGHLVFAGGNPVLMVKNHGSRINHVHFKDLRQDVLEQTGEQKLSFLKAIQEGVFTVPGDGFIDFVTITNELAQCGYEGWIVVEAEQDPAKAPPLHFAKMGRDYIREITGV